MSYNNMNEGYGQYDPYSSQPQSNRYQDIERQPNYEMSQFNNQPASDPNAILNHCRDIDQGINSVESYISQINNLYRRLLSDVDPARENAIRAEAEELADETKNLYRNLIERMKSIKKDPDAGNPRNTPHISRVERRLKAAITSYQQVQVDFRKESETQMARQYRIVRPDATDEEVREAVQDSSNQQIFSQALISSDRRGDAQKVSNMVRARHEEIQKIERDFVELAQMFQDLDALVVQQEAAVERIDVAAEGVREDVGKGRTEIETAIDSARARNRKKWWCLGISILILIIIVVVIVIAVVLTKK